MKILDFLKEYNNSLPNGHPRITLQILKEFKYKNQHLFRENNKWSISRHRKSVMDWILSGAYKLKEKMFLVTNWNVIQVDNNFFKKQSDSFLPLYISEAKGHFSNIKPFMKHKGNIYTYFVSKKKFHFNEKILFDDFLNLKLKNYFNPGVNINDLEKTEFERIVNFIEKYGVDFISFDEVKENSSSFGLDEYLMKFIYIWGQLRTLITLMEKYPTIPYSKSTKRYKKTGLIVKEFQKDMLEHYLPHKPHDLNKYSKQSLLFFIFEYVIKQCSHRLIKKCAYCGNFFILKRKDSKACCSHHSMLIRSKKYREIKKK